MTYFYCSGHDDGIYGIHDNDRNTTAIRGKLPEEIMGVGLGLLFILMGNYLPRLPRNFFFGIRTPWTIASERVWKKSHRVGGWLFVIGGISIISLIINGVKSSTALWIALTPVMLISAILYPIYEFYKEKKGADRTPEL